MVSHRIQILVAAAVLFTVGARSTNFLRSHKVEPVDAAAEAKMVDGFLNGTYDVPVDTLAVAADSASLGAVVDSVGDVDIKNVTAGTLATVANVSKDAADAQAKDTETTGDASGAERSETSADDSQSTDGGEQDSEGSEEGDESVDFGDSEATKQNAEKTLAGDEVLAEHLGEDVQTANKEMDGESTNAEDAFGNEEEDVSTAIGDDEETSASSFVQTEDVDDENIVYEALDEDVKAAADESNNEDTEVEDASEDNTEEAITEGVDGTPKFDEISDDSEASEDENTSDESGEAEIAGEDGVDGHADLESAGLLQAPEQEMDDDDDEMDGSDSDESPVVHLSYTLKETLPDTNTSKPDAKSAESEAIKATGGKEDDGKHADKEEDGAGGD